MRLSSSLITVMLITPFIYVTDNNSATVKDGRLADVAPSILHIMGLEKPADMTGENLIVD